MAQEIERKWFVTGFPKGIQPNDGYVIKQSYLIADDKEIRLREATPVFCWPSQMSPYKMTFKGPGTYVREEVEIVLSMQQYKTLLAAIKGEPIEKLYYKYIVDGYTIEVSRVDNQWYYAEVEFDNEKEMKNFVFPWPEIVIKEVTEDKNYKMKNYWNFKNKQ